MLNDENSAAAAIAGVKSVSSCDDAEDEAHLPEINFFNQEDRVGMKSL